MHFVIKPLQCVFHLYIQKFAIFSPIFAGLPNFTSTVLFKEVTEYTEGFFYVIILMHWYS